MITKQKRFPASACVILFDRIIFCVFGRAYLQDQGTVRYATRSEFYS